MEKPIKLELYKPFKTRGGWKAVVVDKCDDGFIVDHAGYQERMHFASGRIMQSMPSCYDIISEWVEPCSGTMWVNVYDGGLVEFPCGSREEADKGSKNHKRIACIEVPWVEGQGL